MTNSVATETLKCAACGSDFDRERKRGVKPKNCPTCTQRLADEAKEAAAGEEKIQKLHCEACDQDWTRPAQRGKPPKRCPSCSGNRHQPQSNAKTYPQLVATPTQAAPSKSNHYTVARLLSQHTSVPVEDRYKFSYIESELARGQHNPNLGRSESDQVALKRVWATLEGRLS